MDQQQIGPDVSAGASGGHMTVVQTIPSSGGQVQVVQAGQMIQSAGGQQIVVHAGQPVQHLGSSGSQQLQLLQLPVQVPIYAGTSSFRSNRERYLTG